MLPLLALSVSPPVVECVNRRALAMSIARPTTRLYIDLPSHHSFPVFRVIGEPRTAAVNL